MKTLEKFATTREGNYCRNPRRDVEILDGPTLCVECGEEIEQIAVVLRIWGTQYLTVHVDAEDDDHQIDESGTRVTRLAGPKGHLAQPMTRCRYCGTQYPGEVRFVRQAWSEEVHCSRCGAVDGFGLGD